MRDLTCAHGVNPFNPWLEPCALCMPNGAVLGFKAQIVSNKQVVFEGQYVRLRHYPTNELQQEAIAKNLADMAKNELLIDPEKNEVGIHVIPRFK